MAIMTRLSLLASLVVVATCSGCYSLNVSVIDCPFDGITDAVDRSDVVNILSVRGMGGYSSPDPQQIIDETVSKLNLCAQEEVEPRHIRHPVTNQLLGSLLRQDFQQMHTSKQVRFYTLHWSQATSHVKQQYVGYDNLETNNPHRLSLNHRFKRDLVNRNLADVVLYLGKYGETMRIPLEKAIDIIDCGVPKDDEYELILISFSLGSIMLLDTVEALVVSGHCASQRFCNSVSTFFMLANQVPLLLMGKYEIQDDDIERPPDYQFAGSLQWFINQRPQETKRKLTIVAMSDPNDLLSYRIPDWITIQFPEKTFVNVTTSVVRKAVLIPFVGVVADPTVAHTGYGQDDSVIDLIVDGHDEK